MNKRNIDDLLTLIEHTRRDISYGWGGTFGGEYYKDGEEKFDEVSARKAERAIEFIKKIILQS